MLSEERIERVQSKLYSDHSEQPVDIGEILQRYKRNNCKFTCLPLNQFSKLALDDSMDMLSNPSGDQIQPFLPFKQLNQSVISELQRSLLQSKMVWDNYSTALFAGSAKTEDWPQNSLTSRKLQLYNNKETMKQIRLKARAQHDEQINEITRVMHKIHSQSTGVKVYPSFAYLEQQKAQQKQMMARFGGQVDHQDDERLLRQRMSEGSSMLHFQKQCVYAYRNEYCFWGPSSRDGSTMVAYDRKLYLYGGAGANKSEDMLYATTDKQFYKWNPVQLDIKSTPGYRVHHSAVMYKQSMVVFGGEIHMETNHRIVSECSSDIKIISLVSTDVKLLKQTGIQSPRKCHTCEVVGRTLIIQGGIDLKDVYLKDVTSFDILTHKWSVPIIDPYTYYPNGIAYHKSCLVTTNKATDIYRGESENKIPNQGIYYFGGQDKNGQYLDTFLRLNVYSKPMRFEEIECKGNKPIPRCQHSMTYSDSIQMIIIYGGKNDDQSQEGFLNDICLFDIRSFNWLVVEMKGLTQIGRCGHTAAAIDSRLYIFGGYNYNGFVNSNLLILELDNNQAQQMVAMEEIPEKQTKKHHEKKHSTNKEETKLQQEIEKRKQMIDKLNFKNLNTILPMPMKSSIQMQKRKLTTIYSKQPSVSSVSPVQLQRLSILKQKTEHNI